MKVKIYFFVILLILSCFIISCSSPTESSKGNLTGIVHLEGETDHSGIVVALYELAYLDTTIVRINQTYPHIGVIINQHTEFDHRFQTPKVVTQTEVNGNFEIAKIPVGIYNLVIIKDGWGFKYVYEIQIEKGDNELALQPVLFEETVISGSFEDSNNYFLTDHHYIIEDDTELLPNQYLEIQPGSIIRINPKKDLTIHGLIKAQGEEVNMFWVTSNDGFGEELIQYDSLQYYQQMKLSSIAVVHDDFLTFGKWQWGNYSLLLEILDIEITNSILKNSVSGLFCNSILNAEIVNNMFANNKHNQTSNNSSLFLNNTVSEVSSNVFIYNVNGLCLIESSQAEIANNYFLSCLNSIKILSLSISNIHNNMIANINNCDIGIELSHQTPYQKVDYNTIRAIKGIKWPTESEITNNNLICSQYNIVMQIRFNPYGDDYDISAPNNYFGTIDNEEIDALIFDRNDVEEALQLYIGEVDYMPFLTESNSNARIQ